ncbi:hypothetical protein DS843_24285 [Roseomonas genomospecies 6]|uniref:Uncharacterized protein n=1 Tax=Roseomonas genomospecies 6 TaxID=214106 RepID=A0A9W7NFI1_9PROT|nr:hypothetical protein DS843_24285 [Roseomonas genomospecies 6]
MRLSGSTTITMIHPGMQEGRMAGLLQKLTGCAAHANAALAVCPWRWPDHAGRRRSGPLPLEFGPASR